MNKTNTTFVLSLLFSSVLFYVVNASVGYDQRSIIINGQKKILISGSIHYPRSTPQMWPDLIQKAKDGGLDVIQTYVFWNGHEPSPGKYYFEERYDLVKFIKIVQQAGLYVHLRIGPYACAEWNFGGFPVWLKFVPGIEFRTDNEPFKAAMQNFTQKIVSMMKEENLFQTQGGPIIFSQIENEYGPVVWSLHSSAGKSYAKWAAQMALGLNTSVPWIMCKQQPYVPDNIIDTCNGYYCENFKPNKTNNPKMWTEAWTGWYTEYGGAVIYRPVEDMAFAVARFIQNGGSFINYYMYHGGTNFGRTAADFIATSYDFDAPIDEFGLLKEPNWGHLRDLHKAIKLCEQILVSTDPNVTYPGKNQEVHVFRSNVGCAAFLANYDTNLTATVNFDNKQYYLPAWSVSILPDCKTEVYNTARLNAQSAVTKMMPTGNISDWRSYNEPITYASGSDTTVENGLLEQVYVTRDSTDYLWYMTDVNIAANEGFLKNGQPPQLTVMSAGHALHVFVNGLLAGTAYGGLSHRELTFSKNIKLNVGINMISLLSVTVGLPNVGMHFEKWNAGVLGPVTLKGLNEGTRDLSKQKWHGLRGESFVNTPSGNSSVKLVEQSSVPTKQPLTWYKATFNAPAGNEPLALDMSTMTKGQIWINSQSMGRYWPGYTARGNCSDCDYAGTFWEKKCTRKCGEPTQKWYHVPRSWVKPNGNQLVVFEEMGGNPFGISLVKRMTGSVCADIYEGQPTMGILQNNTAKPKAHLRCPPGQKITQIKFASFGWPQGKCGSYSEGRCHAHKSYDVFQKKCVGKQFCLVTVASEVFGGDPCPNTVKKLAVEALCN
ncbi:hypothetical protein ACFE04_014964 [Oxalis oulophora]